MTRLNLILFFALIFSALGLVNAQHKARKQYIELEQLAQAAKQYDQEYGQLQLEQSTWAMHSRIELVATQVLQMRVPDSKRIQVVSSSMKAPEVPATAVASPAAASSTTSAAGVAEPVLPVTSKVEKPEVTQP
jgi:cell division protein FtsL